MKLRKAISLAIYALEELQKPLHVDANLHEHYGADYPLAVSASKQRRELREAVKVLEQMQAIEPASEIASSNERLPLRALEARRNDNPVSKIASQSLAMTDCFVPRNDSMQSEEFWLYE